MKALIEKYLGKSWRSSTCGILAAIIFTIHENPDFVSFLPDEFEKNILGLSKLSVAVLIALGFTFSKDYNVTGSDSHKIPKAEVVQENILAPKKKKVNKKI
jgi:hypothetical protein